MNLLDGLEGRNRATKCDQRVAFAIGSQEPGCQVAHSGTRGSNGNAGLTRQPPDATRNESRILFVPADDGLNGGGGLPGGPSQGRHVRGALHPN